METFGSGRGSYTMEDMIDETASSEDLMARIAEGDDSPLKSW